MEREEQWLNGSITSADYSEYLRERKRKQLAHRKARLRFFRIPQLVSWATARKAARELRLVVDSKFLNQRLLETLPADDDV